MTTRMLIQFRQWAFILPVAFSCIFSLECLAQSNQGGWVVFPSAMFIKENNEDTGEQTNIYGDLRLGYRTGNNLYFGLMYSSIKGSGDGQYSLDMKSFGNSVGYFKNEWKFTFSFFLTGSRTEESNGTKTERSEGQGIQLDLAYIFPFFNKLMVGPMLSYRSMTYRKRQLNDGTVLALNQTQTDLLPYIALYYAF